jgi:RimJ/RimL family protein N-acetyltransferase
LHTEITVRKLGEADWETYREIRLEALRKEPAFFLPSREETAFTELEWRARLKNSNAATFGLFAGDDMAGITTVVRDGSAAGVGRALLVGSYIRKSYRGQGLSAELFRARLAWAKEQGDIHTLVLEHRESNLPVRKAGAKFGFTLAGSREEVWPDGTQGVCLVYELKI